MIRKLVCVVGLHKRLGRAVKWDGMNYRSHCRHCGVAMIKHGNVRWRGISRRRDTLLLTYEAHDVVLWPANVPN